MTATVTEITAPAPADEVTFSKQLNGYDKQQVDSYIKTLTEAYQTAYAQYSSVMSKYKSLLIKAAQLEKKLESSSSNAKAITKTLVDAEVMAQNILSAAEKEAEKIKGDAYIEKAAAKRSVELSKEQIQQTINRLIELIS